MGHRRVGIDSDRALSMNPARGERFWQYGKPALDPGGLSYTSGRVCSFLERPVCIGPAGHPVPGFHSLSFLNHKYLGRSSGELAGNTKERKHRKLQRRHQRSGPLLGRPASGLFSQPLRPTFIGTTRTLSRFSKMRRFCSFQKGRKRVQFPHLRADFLSQRRIAMLEDFRPQRFILHFANPEDLSSFGWILVSPDDFPFDFFKSSNRAVEFFEGVRRIDFHAKLVVCFWGNPRTFSRPQIFVRRSTFLFDPFPGARTGSSSFLRA